MNRPSSLGRMGLRASVPADFERAVTAAIDEAEVGNHGELRVHIERACPDAEIESRARATFAHMGMGLTAEDTGVLLFVSIDAGRAVVCAGAGFAGADDPSFWRAATDRFAEGARRGDLVGAVVHAIGRIGMLFRMHVPGDDAQGNEIPNTVTAS